MQEIKVWAEVYFQQLEKLKEERGGLWINLVGHLFEVNSAFNDFYLVRDDPRDEATNMRESFQGISRVATVLRKMLLETGLTLRRRIKGRDYYQVELLNGTIFTKVVLFEPDPIWNKIHTEGIRKFIKMDEVIDASSNPNGIITRIEKGEIYPDHIVTAAFKMQEHFYRLVKLCKERQIQLYVFTSDFDSINNWFAMNNLYEDLNIWVHVIDKTKYNMDIYKALRI